MNLGPILVAAGLTAFGVAVIAAFYFLKKQPDDRIRELRRLHREKWQAAHRCHAEGDYDGYQRHMDEAREIIQQFETEQ